MKTNAFGRPLRKHRPLIKENEVGYDEFKKDILNEEYGISLTVDSEAETVLQALNSELRDITNIAHLWGDNNDPSLGKIYQYIFTKDIVLFTNLKLKLDCEICVASAMKIYNQYREEFEEEWYFDNNEKTRERYTCLHQKYRK